MLFLFGAVTGLGLCYVRSQVSGFCAQEPQDYDSAREPFDLRRHLNGPMICEGVIYGPTGRVTSRFTCEMVGQWKGDTGRLIERFHYDSGEVEDREWTIQLDPSGAIRAEAPDVQGVGIGRQVGSAVKLEYRLQTAESTGGYVLDAIDWMYLLDSGTIVNRSQFRKFGVRVAELVATIRPKDDIKGAEAAA